MTVDQIEYRVERMFDRLDAQLMGGKLTQEEYDAQAEEIGEWANHQYSLARQC